MPESPSTPNAVTSTQSGVTLTFEQLQELLKASATANAEQLQQILSSTAVMSAEAMRKSLHPENETAPDISIYNPFGERDHPRPALRATFVRNGIREMPDSLTWEEIELTNRLPLGEWHVSKSDGSPLPFKVWEVKSDTGQIQRLEIFYPTSGEKMHNHKSYWDYGLEVLDAAGRTADIVRLQELKRLLDAVRKPKAGAMPPAVEAVEAVFAS